MTDRPVSTTEMLLRTIGNPIGESDFVPSPEEIEERVQEIFKSRVALLFFEQCLRKGVDLGPQASAMHEALTARRQTTDEVLARLSRTLDEIARDEWVLFKTVKPFASTPNDSDWFPFDIRMHAALCEHLVASGEFRLLETAPRQTTLIDVRGTGVTDTTKRGGVFYIDCYQVPSTDYFVYLDTAKLPREVRRVEVGGYPVPVLPDYVEFGAVLFHAVFPERTFTVENYYWIKASLDRLEADGELGRFVEFTRQHALAYAVVANLKMVEAVDRDVFQSGDNRVRALLDQLGHARMRVLGDTAKIRLPFEFPRRVFWGAFWHKLGDSAARKSLGVQALHMLNPIFLADVIKILWRRTIRGGVYEQQ